MYSLLWKYNILSNEMLLHVYFWNDEINEGDNL